MATHQHGILGGFSGKLGTVIGSCWKRLEVMKARPRKRKDNPTPEQLDARVKLALMGAFIKRFSGVLRKTFRGENMSGSNIALAYNIENAITGSYPSYSINYPNVRLAQGDLFLVAGGNAVAGSAGEIVFNWQNNVNTLYAPATDTAVVICYCPEFDRSIYAFTSATRSDMTTTLNAGSFSGKVVHTWMAFISKTDVSESVYCGSVTVL
jgi:hypothetical protein